jgi:hypothetical protein
MLNKFGKLNNLISYIYQSMVNTLNFFQIGNTKPVIVRIHHPIKFRFFYRLVYLLHKDNYAVYIYLPTLKAHFELARMDGGLDLLPPVKLISRLPKWVSQATYCSDTCDKYWNLDWKKRYF